MIEKDKTLQPWEERKLYHYQAENTALGGTERYHKLKRLVREDYAGFWAEVAKDFEWFKPWEKVLEGGIPENPEFKFFTGGYSNVCYNMLDRHLKRGADNRLALIWESESGEKVEYYTYRMLYHEVCRFSNALKNLGLQKGDRIAVFMSNSPAAAIAIMSAYRLGLMFTPLFTGLSVDALRKRLNSFEPKVLVTFDGSYRRGRVFPLKSIIDETLKEVDSVKTVIVKKYVGNEINMALDRDKWWDEITTNTSNECPPTPVEANEIQYVLFTSGTAGNPKGSAQAGIGLAIQDNFIGKVEAGLKENDVYYSIPDVGWAGSESHAILGGWLNGVTLVWQEGAGFAIPSLERFYRTIEKYRVNKVHLAPTVLRMLKAQGEKILAKFDLSSLELMLSMGEPMSPELWHWTVENIGKGKLYLNNGWAMTELGCCFAQSTAFIDPLKPGAVGWLDSPAMGCVLAVLDDEGKELPPETRGNVVVRKPFPGVARTLWKEHERYLNDYYRPIEGVWFCHDEGLIDRDGYIWILGRIDDVINVAGHRIATSEIEGAIAGCSEVESAAAIGVPDPVKEQIPVAFIKLKEGTEESNELRDKINKAVIKSIGKYAQLEEIIFVKQLPATISGKIMRRVIRDLRVHGQIKGDLSTLEDADSVELLQKAMESRREKFGG